MKKIFPFLSIMLLLAGVLRAQNDNTSLLVQSPDGKTVKLIWFLRSVPDDVSGFDIRRKDGLGEWKQLNADPLLPGISLKKDLTPYESEYSEVSRIKEKLKTLIDAGRLKEYDYRTFMSKWRSGDKELQEVVLMASSDFEVSVMCGFGYVDRTISQKVSYQYGLFVQGTDKLLAKALWNYGEVPDLNEVTEVTSKAQPGKDGIKLLWSADYKKLKKNYVSGFNVYRRGIRLNDAPVEPVSAQTPSEFAWTDKHANSSSPEQYSISAETIFGIEGIIRPYTYLPEEHPTAYELCKVTDVKSLGFYFKDGMSIDWTFAREHEKFIKGFYVEKNNLPDGFKTVSELLPPTQRHFNDKSGSPVSAPIIVRVVALYNDKTKVAGKPHIYSYFPLSEPLPPMNTSVSGRLKEEQFTVEVSWDSLMSGDIATAGYQLYMYDDEAGKFDLVANQIPVTTNSYKLALEAGQGRVNKFYVIGVSESGVVGRPGDTVSIQVPCQRMPIPEIDKVTIGVDSVEVQWQYRNIPDLAGFRLFRDGVLVVNEQTLKRQVREFRLSATAGSGQSVYTLQAVSLNGVLSALSAPGPVVATEVKKKSK